MGFVTLFSDFGLQDASVAIAKGILMQYIPLSTIIDINHEVQPFNTAQAAYLFGAAYKNFPAGTCHLLMFDIYASKNPRLILSEYAGHYFLSPDNALLLRSLKGNITRSWICLEMQHIHSFHHWLHHAGIMMARLQDTQPGDLQLPAYPMPQYDPQTYTLPYNEPHEVLHIDQFENVTINFTRQLYEQLSPGRRFTIKFTQVEEINEIKENYSDVREGYKLCRFNSNDHLEICINHGRAASLFGLKLGGKNNNIKISFT